MRNHNEKIKDMAESVLPSTRRKGAREDRALIHRRERARLRSALHDLYGRVDTDCDDANLYYQDRRAIQEMVDDRRSADKVGSLVRWAERTVEKSPRLRHEDWDGRMAVFRRLLPDNTIGRHALSHIEWAVGTPPNQQFRRIPRSSSARASVPDPLREAVVVILVHGAHGDLNRRIKREVQTVFPRLAGTVVKSEVRPVRTLGGHHDIDAFVAAVRHRSEGSIALDIAAEVARRLDPGSRIRCVARPLR